MKYQVNTDARNTAVKFLYQCEAEKVYYFSAPQFDQFATYFHVDSAVAQVSRRLCQGAFDRLAEIDALLERFAQPKWSLARMASMDRSVLRLAAYELLVSEEPVKVILNEAIELAKLYGTEHSGKFVNGILDAIAHSLTPAKAKS